MKTRLIFVLKATAVSLIVFAISVLAALFLLLSDPLTALVGLVLVLCSLAGFFVVAWNQREQP